MEKRIHIIYCGQVQGVGFRFTAERVALRHGIPGFVRNLADGTVEVVCEGEKNILDAFITDMDISMRGYISDSKIDWADAIGEFAVFDIRF